jgi:hypothetical protein
MYCKGIKGTPEVERDPSILILDKVSQLDEPRRKQIWKHYKSFIDVRVSTGITLFE